MENTDKMVLTPAFLALEEALFDKLMSPRGFHLNKAL
jgi:hypothetical protein